MVVKYTTNIYRNRIFASALSALVVVAFMLAGCTADNSDAITTATKTATVAAAYFAVSPDSIMFTLNSAQSAGTLFGITSDSGNTLVAFAPARQYVNVVISSSDIQKGEKYTVYTYGSSTGSGTDGFYSDGSFSGGTEQASLMISDMVTTYGQTGGMNGGPGGMGDQGGPGGRG